MKFMLLLLFFSIKNHKLHLSRLICCNKSSQYFIQDLLTEGMGIIQHTNKTYIKTNDEQLSSTYNHTCYMYCVNMVSVTSASCYIMSASRYHPRYQSRSSMYIVV